MPELLMVNRPYSAGSNSPLPGTSIPLLLQRIVSDAMTLAEQDGLAAKACLGQALKLLRREAPRPEEAGAPATRAVQTLAAWQVRRVATHVRENLASPLRVEELAGLACLAPGYFSKAFRSSFGLTPHAYVMRLRIQCAEQMMVETDEPLCQIALACGLCDQAHLSRVFRRRHGVSPGAWRREQLEMGGARIRVVGDTSRPGDGAAAPVRRR